jgi:hypothetical protein
MENSEDTLVEGQEQLWKTDNDEKSVKMIHLFTRINEDIEKLNKLLPENPVDLIKIEYIVGEEEPPMDFYDFVAQTVQTIYNHGYKRAIADGMTTVMYNMERKTND